MREWMSWLLWGHRGSWLVERDVTTNRNTNQSIEWQKSCIMEIE